MKNEIYVFYDYDYLGLLNLSLSEFFSVLVVYKSAAGPTGLHTDSSGENLLKYLLEDSISINKSGKIFKYESHKNDSDFFASAISNQGLIIRSPNYEIIAAAENLQEYFRKLTIANAYIRLGKIKDLPQTPLLEELKSASLEKLGKIIYWLMHRSSNISIWNRFAGIYGTQPTYIISSNDDFVDRLRTECARLDISFYIAESEADLPCW